MECLQLKCHLFLFSKQLHLFVVHNKKNKPFYETSTFVPGLDPSTLGLSSRRNDVEFKPSSIVRLCSVYQHFDSRTVLSSTMASGEAPRIPEESNQIPVSWTIFPVWKVNALMTSFSLLTPHWTALTLGKSYSQGDVLLVKEWLF